MKRTLYFMAVLGLAVAVFNCAAKDPVEATVKQFMEDVKAGKIDSAMKLVKNKMDTNVPVKIRNYFTGRVIKAYTLIKDDDPKAAKARDMGMATMDVKIEFSTEMKALRFVMGKDGKSWCIKNTIEK